ncbi:hypothetical protein KAH27_03120, partial [bacterium]|nr:hypothetical protein [bacterium]
FGVRCSMFDVRCSMFSVCEAPGGCRAILDIRVMCGYPHDLVSWVKKIKNSAYPKEKQTLHQNLCDFWSALIKPRQ